tara:strand:- start:534 stop:878 length:345 start_codon:yes stop_codon:yes gene_type:complete
LDEKYAAPNCEFALEPPTKVDEMSSLLQERIDTFDGGIPLRFRVILHDLKGQAGTFCYLIILEIARITEQYLKATTGQRQCEGAKCSHVITYNDNTDRANDVIGTAYPKSAEFY